MKVSELLKLLRKNGIAFHSSGGNHDIYYSPITNKKFPVPRHLSKEIPTGTLKKIMKLAGLEK